MHIHPRRYLMLCLILGIVVTARAAEPATTTAPASGPAPKLHCVVLNEASEAAPKTEITVHAAGAAGWMPINGATTGKAGACDLAFPGNTPGLLMLKVTAPGYQDAEVLYLPDPARVIPWLTVTLKGAKQLAGTVVNGDDEPVANAEVTLDTPAGPRQTKTDEKGRFLLKDLMPIRTTVRVELDGVGSATYAVDLASQTEPVKIMLRPQRRVTLRVVDSTSTPVPDLPIQILSPRKAEARTDADGRLPIPGIGAGAARVRVSLEDKFYSFDEPTMTLDIDDGEEPVELQLFAAKGGRICGQVVETIDGEVQGVPAATVWLVEGGRMGQNIMADEDGNFELNAVPAESYLVAAGHPTYATSLARADVEAGKEVQLKFTLVSGTMIRGTLVNPQGTPAEGGIVRVLAWHPKRQTKHPGTEPQPVELPWRATRTSQDGQYILEHVPAGRIELEAVAADGSHRTVVNVQVPPDKEVIESKITLRAHQPKPPM